MILHPTTTGCAGLVCTPERQAQGKETADKGARMVDAVAALDASAAASVPSLEPSWGMETSSAGCGRTVEHSGTVAHRSW